MPRDRWRCSPPKRCWHVEERGLRCASATVDEIQDQSQYTLLSWSICRCGNKTPALYRPDIYKERSNTAARVCGQHSYIIKTNCVDATTWAYLSSTSACYSGCTFRTLRKTQESTCILFQLLPQRALNFHAEAKCTTRSYGPYCKAGSSMYDANMHMHSLDIPIL